MLFRSTQTPYRPRPTWRRIRQHACQADLSKQTSHRSQSNGTLVPPPIIQLATWYYVPCMHGSIRVLYYINPHKAYESGLGMGAGVLRITMHSRHHAVSPPPIMGYQLFSCPTVRLSFSAHGVFARTEFRRRSGHKQRDTKAIAVEFWCWVSKEASTAFCHRQAS